jgi:hypothetical protein
VAHVAEEAPGFMSWARRTPQMFGNSVFHAGTSVAYREYSPGVLTALGMFVPLCAAVTRGAVREGVMTPPGRSRRHCPCERAARARRSRPGLLRAPPFLKGLTL